MGVKKIFSNCVNGVTGWFKKEEPKPSDIEILLKEKIEKQKEYKENTQEYKQLSDDISKLLELKLSETEVKDKSKTNRKKFWTDLLGIGVSAGLTAVFMKRGFKFEEEGTYTSGTFRTFISQKIFKKHG